MDIDETFYDELSSFMPSPNDYGLDNADLDEIIGSTVSQLDSSLDLDLNTFMPPPAQPFQPLQNGYVFSDFYQPSALGSDSSTNSTSSPHSDFGYAGFSDFSTPFANAERTPSTSSGEGMESFDDLINFLNEDDIKIEQLTSDNLLEHTHTQARNTPSPTGSCTSSSGSSTSGVHSDTSDTCSRSSESQRKLHDQVDLESATLSVPPAAVFSLAGAGGNVETTRFALKHEEVHKPVLVQAAPTPSVVLLPNFQLQAPQTAQQPPCKTTQSGAFVPVVPATTVAPIKVQMPKPQVKLLTTPTTSKATVSSAPNASKPKTIYLSSNDFKALMCKMNAPKGGAKINGSVNSQMPKIVMKTSSGKVLTANNIVQPMVTKPAVTKVTSVARPATNSTSSPLRLPVKDQPTNSSFRSSMIDEKMYKKQQRMIKNRESASLSRKKKKEYVVSLEKHINKLEQENYTLKGENVSLRNQLVAFAKTCKCRNSNVSEFVLNSLNAATRAETQHVKIAPKPAPKNLKQKMTAATVKKNVAVLFAMAFMVTMNVGNFQSYLNKQNLEGDNAVLESMAEEPMATGRRLLWVETEEEYNEKLNRNKRQAAELEVPPLHFLRPANHSGNTTENGRGRYGKVLEAPSAPPPLVPASPPLAPKCNGACGSSGNQTEFSRLANNLHKWIDGNDYLNLSMHTKLANELDNPHGFKLPTDYLELKTGMERQKAGKRKMFMDFGSEHGHKQRKMDSPTHTRTTLDNENSLKLYKPKIDEEYLRLFKGIKRQDDTFYVLSFNLEHILLPASAYNKTARPKMSLLLPTGDPNRNGDVVLMQIDCEVFNTTQIELKSHMIPSKLRPNVTKWQSSTTTATARPNDVATNETRRSADKLRDKVSQLKDKQKPLVRTYFMVGPKNQQQADASQEKPRIVEFNSSLANGEANVKNATLYARMRETIQGEFSP